MSLRNYRRKRDFTETPEPRGTRHRGRGRLRFVVQKHAASRLHYDFRLELDGTLKSWAVPKGPSLDPTQKRLAVHVEDHPIDYAGFEGIIPPKQYGSGTVLLWDRGYWSPIADPHAGYRQGRLKFRLHGRILRGVWNLVRMTGRRAKEGQDHWLLIKERDEAAKTGAAAEVTQRRRTSIASRRTIEQIASGHDTGRGSSRKDHSGKTSRDRPRSHAGSMPHGALKAAMKPWVPPQLATLVDRVPEGQDWIHELKFDGYRMLCRIEKGTAKLFTRNGHDWTSRLRRIAEAAAALPVEAAWVDGEVVALMPDGRVSFQTLQNAFDTRSESHLVYYVFDLLYLDGYDLREVPLVDRKRLLVSAVGGPGDGSGLIRYSDHISGQGETVVEEACRRGMEGLVAKRVDAAYAAGRNRNWVKVKCGHRQGFVIGGYTEPGGSRKGFGALLLGVYNGHGQLTYAGMTGTGFSANTLKELHGRLRAIEQQDSPFVDSPRGHGMGGLGVHWVKPELIAEVAFAEWTQEGLLRQAAFQGLREDKVARSVIHEQPLQVEERDTRSSGRRGRSLHRRTAAGRAPSKATKAPAKSPRVKGATSTPENGSTVAGVTLTHPDRVLFPETELTKLALARYYERVSQWLLPHLRGRPLTLLRCPEGSGKQCFYQKHANKTVPDVVGRVEIPEGKGTSCYMVADDLPAVIGLVQLGVLELHTWGAKRPSLDRPDRMTFDLDPDPAVPWKRVIEGARLLRTLLQELGLAGFVKTTGGKGLHVVVPLQPVHTWEDVKAFSKSLAEYLVRVKPDRFVANMAKAKRKGKIFVDYLRNARGATAVAAFSTRARGGAPVSVPLAWDELSDDRPSDFFTAANVPDRLRRLTRDPWREYFTVKQKLTKRMMSAFR